VKIIFHLFVTCCFVPGTLASQANTPRAKIVGTVFLRDSAVSQSFVSGATVRIDGPATLEAETDANGKYVVAGVPFWDLHGRKQRTGAQSFKRCC
jgi:hypothetical protein